MEVRDFHVFCPKAIAGIGKLPDTVADRSIPIRLKRRAPGEQIERFRRHLKPQADGIRGQIGAWAVGTISRLKNAKPTLPDSLSDRQQDGCEPLLAIADAAGGEWPEKARNALIEILTGEVAEDNSIGVRLLTDIRQIFDNQQVASLPTSELVSILCDDNPFWLEFSHGKPISATGLARLLKPYGISHRKLRVGEATPWGYQRSAFEDPWARYLPRNLEQVEQNSNGAGEMQLQELEHIPPVPALQGEESTIRMRLVPDVPLPTNHQGRPRQCSTHGFHVVWWERSLGGGDWVCGRCHPSPGVDSDLGHVLTATEIGFGTS